jgi:fructose-bisphosphate aldolase, class II
MLLAPSQARKLYAHAVANSYAVLAVNADSPAAITDCLQVAKELDAPIIIETSLWQLTGHSFGAGNPITGIDRYMGSLFVMADSDEFESVPVLYHTDHIKGPDTEHILRHAISKAASSISLDSSDLTHEENIELMSKLCDYAKDHRLSTTLEMEAGVDDGVTPLSDTQYLFGEVEKRHPGFLALWAPGVGTKHGLGDMAGFSPEAVKKHRDLASDLAGRPIGIALHGSSGLTNDQLSAAVEAGVAKVNWSSESLLLRSKVAQEYYATHTEQLEKSHPDWKNTAMDNGVQQFVSTSYQPKVAERIKVLKGAGQASQFFSTI